MGGFFAVELLTVYLALAFGVENGVVAVGHVLPVGQFGKGGVLTLTDVVQLVGVAVFVARGKSLAHKVGVVPVFPAVVVGELLFEPLFAAVECPSVDSRIGERLAAVDGFFSQPGFDVDESLGFGTYCLEDCVRPPGLLFVSNI